MIAGKNELKTLGAVLEDRLGADDVPEPTTERIRAIEAELGNVAEAADLSDAALVDAVNAFIREREKGEDVGSAMDAAKDGTMSVDPASVSLVAAVWLLLQTEFKLEGSKSKGWSVLVHKKAAPIDATMKLLSFLKAKLGL